MNTDIPRVLTSNLEAHVGKKIALCGWVHTSRNLGSVVFVIIRDRAGMAQAVTGGDTRYNNESVIRLTGVVAANPKAPGGFEVQAQDITLLSSEPPSNLPLTIHKSLDSVGLGTILDHRYLALRHPAVQQIFAVQAVILKYFATYMRSQDFTEIKSSKIIGSGTEGGTGLFELDYFGQSAFLAQSPQFYKQAMVASGMERVFEIGAAYRAEKHDTARHLNEYVSLDVEMGFIDSEQTLMDVETEILVAIMDGLATECSQILASRNVMLPSAAQIRRIPRIDYAQALDIIAERATAHVLEINPQGERILCQWAQEHHNIEAVFVYAFPRKKRPFYTAYHGRHTRSFDLIFRGLEITTGGMRIHQHHVLQEVLPRFGITPQSIADYLTIFKYGCPPHGGFAIGLERLTQKILNLDSVKEASLFPRDRTHLRP